MTCPLCDHNDHAGRRCSGALCRCRYTKLELSTRALLEGYARAAHREADIEKARPCATDEEAAASLLNADAMAGVAGQYEFRAEMADDQERRGRRVVLPPWPKAEEETL